MSRVFSVENQRASAADDSLIGSRSGLLGTLDRVHGDASIAVKARRAPFLYDRVMRTFEEFQLFEPDICTQLRELAEHEKAHEAKIVGEGTEVDLEVRSASRYKVADKDTLNTLLDGFEHANNWDFCTYWGTESLPHAEIIHYKPGDFYKPHTDWSPSYKERKMSMTVQLSGTTEYQGGDVKLYDGPEAHTLYRKQGSATVWPSWTLHEVERITSGERWALVAWMLGPDFY